MIPLRTCKFCCKSRQEVVFCLLRCKNRYRRKHSNASADRKITFFAAGAADIGRTIFQYAQSDRYTSIFCNALVIKVDLSFCIQCYVLKKSISLDRIVNVRLRVFVKVDNFCIASALEVEYSVVIPAMLVITDQKTFRICGNVVLPVPESPKKSAVFSPFMSVFAEQCIEAIPFSGR